MTTLDILRYYGGEPANFLEVSGRTYMMAEKAVEIVVKRPDVKAVFRKFLWQHFSLRCHCRRLGQIHQGGKIKGTDDRFHEGKRS